MKQVLIVGGGFAGINAVRSLSRCSDLEITLIDRRNHHLFQPLLYQVAMAGLSPADIAAPIRTMVGPRKNIRVYVEEVTDIDLEKQQVITGENVYPFDYLILACGAQHAYFGHPEWEEHAPGLKTLAQATEIRRRVLTAFETAEVTRDPETRRRLLSFVVVGGGPTGVELAGAIGEMSRHTLSHDYRNIDPTLTRITLIEAGPRILHAFSEEMSARAARDLEALGVQIWTNSLVTNIDEHGVGIGEERLHAATVIWGAGVEASKLGLCTKATVDRQGRVEVEPDLSLAAYPMIFVAGDMAHAKGEAGRPLPGVAPVAMQQGRWIARNIRRELAGKPREAFHYRDKGQMATIGRSKAVLEMGKLKLTGWLAWMAWLLVHIYYLSGFKNRLFVLMQWAWSYWTYRKGARLIVDYRAWRLRK
ncbi:MAG: NADH dehydrogenase [Kiritimatiellia bacterium]|jgi:NADH:ubiquinone reductase (H+-translocating)